MSAADKERAADLNGEVWAAERWRWQAIMTFAVPIVGGVVLAVTAPQFGGDAYTEISRMLRVVAWCVLTAASWIVWVLIRVERESTRREALRSVGRQGGGDHRVSERWEAGTDGPD